MGILSAARLGDKTGHNGPFNGNLSGSTSGPAHGAAAGSKAPAPVRGARYGGAIAEGGSHAARAGKAHPGELLIRVIHLAGLQESKKKSGKDNDPIKSGSPNVLVGSEEHRAARAGVDKAECSVHSNRDIAQGSSTVIINGYPAARTTEKLSCSGGKIVGGCETVLFGGDSKSSAESGDDGGGKNARGKEPKSVKSARRGDELANKGKHPHKHEHKQH